MKSFLECFDSPLIAWFGGVFCGLSLDFMQDPNPQKHFVAQLLFIVGIALSMLSIISRHVAKS